MTRRIATEFFENNVYRFINLLATNLGGAIFTIFLARILKPELFGTYTLAISFAFILMALGDLGIHEAIMRYISLNIKNMKKARTYFYFLFKIKILILFSLSAILMIFSKILSNFYNNPDLVFPITISAFYLFFYSIMQIFAGLFYAFKNIKAVIYKELIFQIIRISLIPLLLFFSAGFLVAGSIIFLIVASIIGILFSIFYFIRKYPDFFKKQTTKIDKKELFTFMKYLSIGSLSILFLIYTDILILGKFVGAEYVGFYRTATSLALIVSSILTINVVIVPIITRIGKQRIERAFNIILYYFFVLSIPMTLGLIMMAKYFIRILFGYEYLSSVIPLYILAFLVILLPLGELFRVLFVSKGKSEVTAKIIAITSILNILLNFIFIYYFLRFGEIYAVFGAGFATILSRIIIFFSLARASRKQFNIRIKKRIVIKPLIAGAVMAIFLFYFNKLIQNRANIFLVINEIVLAALVYFIVLYLIKGISKKELNYVKKTIKDSRK